MTSSAPARFAVPLLILCLAASCSGPDSNDSIPIPEDGRGPGPDGAADVRGETETLADAGPGDGEQQAELRRDEPPSELAAPQCAAGEGCFLDPCDENGDCQSGWCVQHLGDRVCSQLCQEECPAGWVCRQVAGTDPDVIYICVSGYATLCRPCHGNDDCTSVGGANDACLDYGEAGWFCGGQCGEDGSCPWGFSCQEAQTAGGATLKQCVNDVGECPCTASSVRRGLTTPCSLSNEEGTCEGKRVCGEDGLSDCDAYLPAAETCNGIDDDCDGDVDEPSLVDGNYANLCDDKNGCTTDKCVGEGGCLNDLVEVGPCEDGNPCTVADHCVAGTCLGDPVECDDENPCTDNVCTDKGGCEYPPAAGPCDDGNPCTLADQCAAGVCKGTVVPCDCQVEADCAVLEDGDVCNGSLTCDTTGIPFECIVDPASVVACAAPVGADAFCLKSLCDPATGDCSIVADHEGFPCDDGDACTVNDQCESGACSGGPSPNCNDGNPCTDDSCDQVAGCVQTPNTAPCNDNDVCTFGDACAGGECVGGPGLKCDDGNGCTEDACDPVTGCTHQPTSDLCDDGNACTVGDKCAQGACVGLGNLECEDGDPCTDNACDPGVGCMTTLNKASCDDGDMCTIGDHCHLGACIHSGEFACNDGNVCTTDSCDSGVGCVHSPNSLPCDDKNACTSGDHCQSGTCVGPSGDSCDDKNVCTQDWCDPTTGCQHSPVNVVCDDGDPCTISDHCQEGSCKGGGSLDCSDGNLCTKDLCLAPGGCTYQPADFLPCGDANTCTADACDPAKGCVFTPVADYTPCGGGNVCLLGQCKPAPTTSTVFITNGTWTGKLGGLAGADLKCQGEAVGAGLSGKYVAFLSTTTVNAKDRIPDAQYLRVDKKVVASSKADLLDGTINFPINLTATGAELTSVVRPWTSTDQNGVSTGNTCQDWTTDAPGECSTPAYTGKSGEGTATTAVWTNYTNYCCWATFTRLYCFQVLP